MTDFLLTHDPLTGDPIESYGAPVVPLIGRDRRIIREVAQAHRVSVDDITGPRRFRNYVAARREAMQRIRNELGYSYPQIGRIFDRDHSSIIWACRGGRPEPRPTTGIAA